MRRGEGAAHKRASEHVHGREREREGDREYLHTRASQERMFTREWASVLMRERVGVRLRRRVSLPPYAPGLVTEYA